MSKENKYNHTILRRITKVRPRHWVELETVKGLTIDYRLKNTVDHNNTRPSCMMPRSILNSVWRRSDRPILYSVQ